MYRSTENNETNGKQKESVYISGISKVTNTFKN